MKVFAYSSLCVKYLDEVVSLALSNKYNAVEWDLNYIPPVLNTSRRDSLLKIIRDSNLHFKYHLPYSFVEIGHPDIKIRNYSINTVLFYLDFIHSLHGEVAIIHVGAQNDCLLRDCLNSLLIIADYANELNIKLCVENLIHGVTTVFDSLLELLSIDNVGLCFDTGHAYVVNQSVKNYIPNILLLLDKVKHSHVYFSEDSSFNHIPFTKKNLFVTELLKMLFDSSCEWYTMELDIFEEQKQQLDLLDYSFKK